MLNYAEAMCELGEFDQTVADVTINKLRPRANVKLMKVSEINSAFDPKRDLGNPDYPNDYEVSPLLWEIRRERRIELFSEGFRFDDLRRWKKCHYALKKKLGQYVRASDFNQCDYRRWRLRRISRIPSETESSMAGLLLPQSYSTQRTGTESPTRTESGMGGRKLTGNPSPTG